MPVVTRGQIRREWQRVVALFPREVLIKIVVHLGYHMRDLAAFMIVCRDWRDAMSGCDGFLNLMWCGAKTLAEIGHLRMQPEDQVCFGDDDVVMYTQTNREAGTVSIVKRSLCTWPLAYIQYDESLEVEHPKFCFANTFEIFC